MRIALIALHFADYATCLAEALAVNHEVLLVLERGNAEAELGGLPESVGALTIRIVEHVPNPISAIAQAARIHRWLRDFAPDVVHAQEVIYDSWALALLRVRRWPLVLTVHDPSPHSGEEMRGIRRRYVAYQRAQRHGCDEAITHGATLVADLERVVPSLRGRVSSIPHGVLGRRSSDAPAAPYDPAGHLLFLGRMHPYKGLAVFLDALTGIRRRGRSIKAVVAGRGPALDEARDDLALLPDLRVEKRFLSREEMLALVDASSIVMAPYLDGTQSGIAMLAMGRGRPVVASRVGSLPEVVHDDVNGVLVPPGDPEALAQILEALLDDPPTLRRQAAAAVDLADREFSWAWIAEATVAAYGRAIDHHRNEN